MNILTYLKRTLKQLSPYVDKPLTAEQRQHAITLRTKAVTECIMAVRELQALKQELQALKFEVLREQEV